MEEILGTLASKEKLVAEMLHRVSDTTARKIKKKNKQTTTKPNRKTNQK